MIVGIIKGTKEVVMVLSLKNISENKNTSVIVATGEELLFISEQSSVNLAKDESTWVADSSASFHLTPMRDCFSSYTTEYYDYVKMGNNSACKIIGIGNVCLLTSTSCRMILRYLCHVLDIRLNVIIGRMARR